MKFSIVTISYNQAEFLERTLKSVLGQKDVHVEYIVVDPGSTDGSRDIINRYRGTIDHLIFEPDQGPADGLNRGFAKATGDVFGYLNSDDTLEPGALRQVALYFQNHPRVDVVSGNGWLTDSNDTRLRKLWSDPFRARPFAFGATTIIQPSTFIRAEAFRKSGGFNVTNRSNWDGELLVDLYLSGAQFGRMPNLLSTYRLHAVSITNSGSLHERIQHYQARMFEKLIGRPRVTSDQAASLFYRALKHARNPRAMVERLTRGPIYRRGV